MFVNVITHVGVLVHLHAPGRTRVTVGADVILDYWPNNENSVASSHLSTCGPRVHSKFFDSYVVCKAFEFDQTIATRKEPYTNVFIPSEQPFLLNIKWMYRQIDWPMKMLSNTQSQPKKKKKRPRFKDSQIKKWNVLCWRRRKKKKRKARDPLPSFPLVPIEKKKGKKMRHLVGKRKL